MTERGGAGRGDDGGGGALREPLASLSAQVRAGTLEVAEEGNRWFLMALGWSAVGAAQVGHRVGGALEKLRATLPRRSTRERLQKVLMTEARRARLDPRAPELRSFAENVSTLIELVLDGTIQLDDVGFAFEGLAPEADGAAGGADGDGE